MFPLTFELLEEVEEAIVNLLDMHDSHAFEVLIYDEHGYISAEHVGGNSENTRIASEKQ